MFNKITLIALCLFPLTVVHAEDCSIKLNLGKELYPAAVERNVNTIMTNELAQKGYTVTTSDDAEYSLKMYFGHMMTTKGCFTYSSRVIVMNSGLQTVAEAFSETSNFRQLFGSLTIPRTMALKSFRKVLNDLPVCQ